MFTNRSSPSEWTMVCVGCVSRYTEHRHWLHPRWWIKWLVIILSILAIEIGSTASISAWPQKCEGGGPTDHFLLTYLPILITGPFLLSNVVITVAKRIRKHKSDGYGLKVELTWLGILCLLSCGSGIFSVIMWGTGRRMQVFADWSIGLLCWLLNWLQLGYPLFLSRQWSRRPDIETMDQLGPLLEIPQAFQAFLGFSAKEFNSER
jgi:hypothetical protein